MDSVNAHLIMRLRHATGQSIAECQQVLGRFPSEFKEGYVQWHERRSNHGRLLDPHLFVSGEFVMLEQRVAEINRSDVMPLLFSVQTAKEVVRALQESSNVPPTDLRTGMYLVNLRRLSSLWKPIS